MGSLNSRGGYLPSRETEAEPQQKLYLDPQTVYDETHSWQNANDRVAWQRAIEQPMAEQKRMGWALLLADPGTPNNYIFNNMTRFTTPPRFGYDRTEPGMMEVAELTGDENFGHLNDFMMTDFSGSQGRREGSDIPSLPMW